MDVVWSATVCTMDDRELGRKEEGHTIGVESEWTGLVLDQKGQQLAQRLGHAVRFRVAEICRYQRAVGEGERGDDGRQPQYED